ncbi:hypothetical protein A9239_07490 [Methanosarcina sp. A14]|uniref:Polysaccharide biosynthesis protein n=1 Tax=Methanosarcina barkeri CM1 TaxID=796385 RepID=A0A0G3C8N1_METBA|nr:hypothetical protein MCM1_1294 [Methanosarcina barkeri CM1]OED10328.1 hypothetical protein A9239_07490 [Methanosarcina sp. A14]
MLKSLLTFFIFLLASLSTRVIIMTYYPQYTYFAHVFSTFLISIGMAFSISSMIMKYISFLPTISPKMKKQIKIGLITLIFASTLLETYYGSMPQTQ